jgi:tRNA A-37 threonylcarbamoyl transferase component Bud32
MMSQQDELKRLPKWVWGEDTEGLFSKAGAFTVLIKEKNREQVNSILSILREKDDVPDQWLAAMPPPADPLHEISSVQLQMHVSKYLDDVAKLSGKLPQDIVANALQRNGGLTSAERLKKMLDLMSKLSGRTSEDTTNAILREVIGNEDEASADETAEKYLSSLNYFEGKFGAAIMPVFEQLKQLASFSIVKDIRAESALENPRSPTALVTLENNWIDRYGTKAPIGFCRYPDHTSKPYGYISVPLIAVSKQKADVNYKLQFETASPLHHPWPPEWDHTYPEELSIRQDEWRSGLEHQDRFFYSFKYTIPVRDPKFVKNSPAKFEFTLKLLDADTNAIAGKPTKFSWSEIGAPIELPETVSWPHGIDINNVERHPLGPQKFKSDILARVFSKSSFAVIAPRRFGKSTLLEFVERKALEDKFLVVRIDCTSYNIGAGHFKHFELWSEISKQLQKATGAAITLESSAEVLPEEAAFDFVKKAAAQTGYKGVFLLFDESQLFFNVKDGTILGDRLKGRIERAWSRSSPGMVPVLFGFVGLRSFRERAGANLCGLLDPFNTNELDESEINSLILAVTSGKLHTTREARLYLAQVTGNLYILRVLVNKLYKLIREEGRTWANYDDVYTVEKAVSRSLSDGGEEDVANYIKDVLNDAHDINDWLPNPAILLAIAIVEAASAAQDEFDFKDAIRIIDQWCKRAASARDIRLVYTEEQYRHQMTILQERGVIRGLSFSSPLLEAWLRIGRNLIKDQFEDILMRSAAHRIKLPHSNDATFVQDGSEATIRTVMVGDVRYAYRTVALNDKESRERFYKCQEILEKLKEKVRTRKAGSEYIFNLHEVGIAADNENVAVQVYQWVEGQDLTSSIGCLSAEYVADLGLKLSKGVQFLHDEEILHRDIAPRNIVVADQSDEPVIIDFGFAKRYSSESFTRIEGDYAAPEVSGNICTWSTAADIYSIGSTLNKLLVSDSTCKPLREILQQCLALDASKRPTAHALVLKFQEVSDELKISYKKDAMWKRVQDVSLRETKTNPWYEGIVDKFRVSFNAAALGCMGTTFDRTKRAAFLLTQVFEAYNAERGRGDQKLGICVSGGSKTALALATNEMRFIADLRNDHSHGGYRSNNAKNAQNGIIADEKMLRTAMKAAQQMGEYVRLTSLVGLTELLITPSKDLSK